MDASRLGDRIELDNGWLFHVGDQPDYASPTLDDTHWTPVDIHKPLSEYGVPTSTRFSWLRLHVHLAPGQPPPVLGTLRTLGSYEVFVNGRLLNTIGDMNRHTLYDRAFMTQFPIPVEALNVASADGDDLVIALRCALQVPTYRGTRPAAPFLVGHAYLGTARSLAETATSYTVQNVVPVGINFLPSLLTGLVALALFLAVRDHREFFLLALFCFCQAGNSLADLFSWLLPYNVAQVLIESVLNTAVALMLLAFLRALLPKRHELLFGILALVTPFSGIAALCWASGSAAGTEAIAYAVLFALYVTLCPLLFRSLKQASPNLRRELELILVGLSLNGVAVFIPLLDIVLDGIHKNVAWLRSSFLSVVHIGPFNVDSGSFAQLIFTLCLLVFLVNRTVRIAKERNRAAAEIEAARSVQQLLLSRSSVQTPGFQVDHVYRPASEVGGDFYLLSPDPQDGSLLVVVGDVSGKGLSAAMNVAMILGVLRRETSRAPEQVLCGLNEALVKQGATGFTTACCVHLRQTGEFTVANAGHIAPYLNGTEVEAPAALPLGLVPDQTYSQVSGRMRTDQQMTLLSDGVLEARSSNGELYGFQRLSTLTLEPATLIADTAQSFGQEDDITVVSIALQC